LVAAAAAFVVASVGCVTAGAGAPPRVAVWRTDISYFSQVVTLAPFDLPQYLSIEVIV
jgi:hypothetical protein